MSGEPSRRPKLGKGGHADPPKATQFKPGQSGNPRGRPKRKPPATIDEVVARAFGKMIEAQEGGEVISIPLVQAMLERSLLQAAKGDRHARRDMITLMRHYRWIDDCSEKGAMTEDERESLLAENAELRSLLREASAIIDSHNDDDDYED